MAANFTLTGNFRQLTGSDTGYISISLSGFRPQIPRTSDGVLADVFTSTAPAASSFSVTLYSNDVILPGSTFYLISLFDASGTPVIQNVPYLLQGNSGGTDLATLTPLVSAPPSLPTPPSTIPASEFFGSSAIGSGSGTGTYRLIDGQDLSARATGGVFYVGGNNATLGNSTDTGSQINFAYGLLPASGGVINVLPNPSGTPYTFSTPIVFGTEGKLVILDLNGSTLQFAPQTGNTALVLTSVDTSSGGTAVYHGTITGGGSNALAGKVFQIAGFGTGTTVDNDGEYYCTASSTTTLTLSNGMAVSQTTGATATPCGSGSSPTAITFSNQATGPNAFVNIQQVRNGILMNGTSVQNWGPGTASQSIGIDFSGAGRLSTQNFQISGFAVGRVCLKPVSWGASDIGLTVSYNNTGTIFFNAQEDYHMLGGALIVNQVGHRTGGDGTAGGASSAFTAVSFDANNKHGFIQSAGSGETATFTACHFENFDLTHVLTTHYIETQTMSVIINGGDALDDQSTGSIDYWFKVGQNGNFANLMVYGLEVSGNRNPSVGVFIISGRGFLSGSNGASSVITNLYTTVGNGTVTSFFDNGANNATNALMEVSGSLTVDGNLQATGALTPFTPVPTGFTVVGSPTYSGQYQKIGKLVYWAIHIIPHSGSTVAATLGVSTFGLPNSLSCAQTAVFTISDLASLNGMGAVIAGATIDVPTFSANGNDIYLNGSYITT